MKQSEYAGKTVILKHLDSLNTPDGNLSGAEYRVEDYWINVSGSSWMWAKGNPACIIYAMRSGFGKLPIDDRVLYGKVGMFGHLIHESEIDKVLEAPYK